MSELSIQTCCIRQKPQNKCQRRSRKGQQKLENPVEIFKKTTTKLLLRMVKIRNGIRVVCRFEFPQKIKEGNISGFTHDQTN